MREMDARRVFDTALGLYGHMTMAAFRYPRLTGQSLPDLLWRRGESYKTAHDDCAQ